jgi:L-ribulokinase
MALMAAGVFSSIEDAQQQMCLPHTVFEPEPQACQTYDEMYELYRKLYFAMGQENAPAASIGDVLPALRRISARAFTAV